MESVDHDTLRLRSAELAAAVEIFQDERMTYEMRVYAVDRFLSCLAWLWDAVAGPVLHDLRLDAAPAAGTPWPRLWWVPTGLLCSMPLHAAGHHDEPDPQARTVFDRAVSSYAPTLRSLLRARWGPATTTGQRGVVVSATDVPGHARLTAGDAEAAVAASHLPEPMVLPRATPGDVLTALHGHVRALRLSRTRRPGRPLQ
jgi:hypothetical protein